MSERPAGNGAPKRPYCAECGAACPRCAELLPPALAADIDRLARAMPLDELPAPLVEGEALARELGQSWCQLCGGSHRPGPCYSR